MAVALRAGTLSLSDVQGRAVRVREAGTSDVASSGSVSFRSSNSSLRGSVVSLPMGRRSRRAVQSRQVICAAQDLAQQIKEMAAAEKRWESQVKEGKVKSLSAKESGYAVELSNFTLLDVRPSPERKKAWVKNSLWIPIYDKNKNFDPSTSLTKFSNFVMGGWWSGATVMEYNGRFMPDVVSKVPKSANVIVACQKGLRSLAACEQLYKAGYRNLFWLNGGLDTVEDGDMIREGPVPFKFAGIGGMSEFLGWTDVQREVARKEGFGFRVMLLGRLMAVVLGADLLLVGGQQLAHFIQTLRQ